MLFLYYLFVVVSHCFHVEQFYTFSQTGCMGCASGKNAGPRNIFGNKYGQNLAAVQIAREKRLEAKRQKEAEEAATARLRELQRQGEEESDDNDDDDDDQETDDDTDDDDDDDYGPSPAAGIWAGSQKLQEESEKLADPEDAGDEETDDEEDERPAKKIRADD